MREVTKKLLEMVDNGLLEERMVILACVNYMTDFEVNEMANLNNFFEEEDEEDKEDDE